MAEEQTKIEKVRSQLKALEYDSEHAGQTADALDNLPVFWSFWEDSGEPEGLFKHQYLLFTNSSAVFHIKPVMMYNDGRKLQIERRLDDPRYDDKEFAVLLEMVKRGRAFSEVQHDKRFTTGIMLELRRTVMSQSWSVGQA